MSGIETKLEKLNASNYSTWELVITSLMKSKGLWDHVSNQIDVKETPAEEIQRNEEAKTLMYASMEASQIVATGSCQTAHDLWTKIRENHHGAETDLRNNALAEFLGFKYHKGETIVQYCGRYEMTLGLLLSTSQKVDESTKIWVFRNSLPKEIKTIVNTWAMANPSGLVSELITQLKIQHHLDKNDVDDQSVALYSGVKSERNKISEPQRAQPSGINQSTSSTATNNSTNHTGSQSVCTYCKLSGHIWKACKKLKADNQRKKRFSSPSVNRPSNSNSKGAYIATQRPQGAFKAIDKIERCVNFSKHTWIVDSGATSHMTQYKSYLHGYKHYDEPHEIFMGTGMIAKAYGEGSMYFTSGKHKGKLCSVLWVPQMKENLFSLGSAISMGYCVKFSDRQVHFIKDDTVQLTGYCAQKNLYTINLNPVEPSDQEDQIEEKDHDETDFLGASLEDWHKRFNHVGMDTIKLMAKTKAVIGLNIEQANKTRCEDCIMGKITRCSHPNRAKHLADNKTAILHIDTVGPLASPSIGGSKYFVLATEEYSSYKLIEFVAEKSEVPQRVIKIINQVLLESKRPVKLVTTDNGTEYRNSRLRNFLQKEGIIHDCSTPYTPEQNGCAERANRTIIEGVRTLLSDSKLPTYLWSEAAATVVYTTNRTLSVRDKTKTKYELYFKDKPIVSNLRRFGQYAIAKRPQNQIESKWARKGKKLIFVGYTSRSNTYRLYDPDEVSIIISCDVVFLDTNYGEATVRGSINEKNNDSYTLSINLKPARVRFADDSTRTIISNDTPRDSLVAQPAASFEEPQKSIEYEQSSHCEDLTSSSATTGDSTSSSNATEDSYKTVVNAHNSSNSYDVEDTSNSTELQEISRTITSTPKRPYTRSQARQMKEDFNKDDSIPSWFWKDEGGINETSESALTAFTLDDEPRTLKDAMSGSESANWQQAMDDELEALAKNNTWTLVNRPSNIRPIKNKWVFKKKLDPHGNLERYKARLVAKGYSQIENIDYKETFAPTASMNTIRILFGIANHHGMEILQFDVKTAFLYGDLNETIYMEYPEGYPNPQNKVCKLIKSLYGLKQAPRQWNIKFDNFLKKFHLTQSNIDRCLYYNEKRTLFLVIYVDDGLVATLDNKLLENLVDYLKEHLDLKVMNCEAFLGFRVSRNREKRTLCLYQTHFTDKILEKFGMADCKPASTPEEVGAFQVNDSQRLPEEYPFKELVGSLLYLVTCSRPDIAHALSIASRTSAPTFAHWQLLKRILRYLQGTRDVGIRFRWEKRPELVGYSDADYANDVETRRSTSGFCIFYGSTPIAWRCQRQSIISLSTTEAEYISGCDLVKELIPLRELMLELGQISEDPTKVLIDNQSTVKIAKDDMGQKLTKHIDVRQKWLTEQHANKKIEVKYVRGEEQAADILTKPLHKTKFITNRNLLVSSIALVTALSIVVDATDYDFLKTSAVTFQPSKFLYVIGTKRFNLTLDIINPCEVYFKGLSPKESDNVQLITDCKARFRQRMENSLTNCKLRTEFDRKMDWYESTQREAGLHGVSEPMPAYRDLKKIAKKEGIEPKDAYHPEDTFKHIVRRKRFVQLLIYAGRAALVGAEVYSIIKTSENSNNVDTLKIAAEEERALMKNAMSVLNETRLTIHALDDKSVALGKRIDFLDKRQDYFNKAMALVSTYDNQFQEIAGLLEEMDADAAVNHASPALMKLMKQKFWIEPASQHSKLRQCQTEFKDENFQIQYAFEVPMLGTDSVILKAEAFRFWNYTDNSWCWNSYVGPSFILFNKPRNCYMAVDPEQFDGGVLRGVNCTTENGKLNSETLMYSTVACTTQPHRMTQKIQIKEYNGFHKIYCYPFNITIRDKTYPCPLDVFSMPVTEGFEIDQYRHQAVTIDSVLVNPMEVQINRELVHQLIDARPTIVGTNLTKLEVSWQKISNALNNFKEKIELKKFDVPKVLTAPFEKVWELKNRVMEWIADGAIIFAIIGIIILLLLTAPLLEVFILLLKFVRKGIVLIGTINANIIGLVIKRKQDNRSNKPAWMKA